MGMTSTAAMVTKLEGCQGTGDLTEWEEGFVEKMVRLRDDGRLTSISEKQVETLEQLHNKHFG